jgi:oxygen-independent coproporphyrinogen-3 oxidase
MSLASIYIHVPFCAHRCGYCDFNTYAGLTNLIPAYIQAVYKEIEFLSSGGREQMTVGTIYFGGGTPSLLPAAGIEEILSMIYRNFKITGIPEICMEANPGTITKEYLSQLRLCGVNRLSLGMQSANEAELRLLGRQHSFDDVVCGVDWAKQVGFENLNLDLIYAFPSQRMDSWLKSLDALINLQPQHVSLYALTLEPGTPLYHQIETGELPVPDEDLAADMYEVAADRLVGDGYIQYEISNWAYGDADGKIYTCEHNLQYWRNLPYLGLGAGAHGYIANQRTVNVSTPLEYIRRLTGLQSDSGNIFIFPQTPASHSIHLIDAQTEIGETMMMGLRLVKEGISNVKFAQRFGKRLRDQFENEIDKLIAAGLLEWIGKEEILRLTGRGRLLGNQVFIEFI